MTEGDWNICLDPQQMLSFLRNGKATDRKVRLHAVACCQRVIHWTKYADHLQGFTEFEEGPPEPFHRGEDYRHAVLVAERFADGEATEEERFRACQGAEQNILGQGVECDCDPFVSVVSQDVVEVSLTARRIQLTFLDLDTPTPDDPVPAKAEIEAGKERASQADLLRDVFGNPFCPVEFDHKWRTSTVVSLARQMYDEREFGPMPILADALQDAGCDNDDILNHCRGPGPHVRGCWVVDLILGKE